MGFFSKKVVWKDINGYEGLYQVSNEGKVKSLKRYGRKEDKELNPSVNNVTGYFTVSLYRNGAQKTKHVHQLVAEAFCKKPKTKEPLHVHHKNGKKLKNHASNLEWIPASEHNSMESKGRHKGEKNNNSKLTEAQVREIKIIQKNYYRGQDAKLAREYGVSRKTIGLIRHGKLWGHINV